MGDIMGLCKFYKNSLQRLGMDSIKNEIIATGMGTRVFLKMEERNNLRM